MLSWAALQPFQTTAFSHGPSDRPDSHLETLLGHFWGTGPWPLAESDSKASNSTKPWTLSPAPNNACQSTFPDHTEAQGGHAGTFQTPDNSLRAHPLHCCPMAAEWNRHKPKSIQKIILPFWRSEIEARLRGLSSGGLQGWTSSWTLQRRMHHPPTFPSCWRPPAPQGSWPRCPARPTLAVDPQHRLLLASHFLP